MRNLKNKILFGIGCFCLLGIIVMFTTIFDKDTSLYSTVVGTITYIILSFIMFFFSRDYIKELIDNFKNRKEISIAERKLNDLKIKISNGQLYKSKTPNYLNNKYDIVIEEAEKKAREIIINATEELNNQIIVLNTKIETLNKEKLNIEKELEILKPQLKEEPIIIDKYLELTSEETKTKLQLNQQKQKDYYNKLVNLKNNQKDKNNIKQLLRSFDLECDVIIKNISSKNSSIARSKINSSYNQLNSLYKYDDVSLDNNYLEIKLEELTLYYSYIVQKENELEDNRARRQLLLEEEKAEKERQLQREKVEKDLTQHNKEIDKLMAYMNNSKDEFKNQLYVDKIKELEEQIKILKEKKEKINELDNIPKAGYVYIISNIGSFGEDIYKIGMTRRLEPMDRIKELGDASVPFPFDVHALIFSSNAPELETLLHNTFRNNQLNKLNNKKEFFKVNLQDIKELVLKNHNATVDFIDIPEAIQYRESNKFKKEII